jgi:putative transposase
MGDSEEWLRKRAIQRHLGGEKARTICASLGRTEQWFYKWLKRFREGDPEWFREHSRKPLHVFLHSSHELEEAVKFIRLELYNRGQFCGAQAIRWRMEDEQVTPLPCLRTIDRILARHGLTHRRTGPYEPKGKRYPALDAPHPGSVHQSDFVGPRYLKTPLRYYSLNTIDLATGRCGVQPVQNKLAIAQTVWQTWLRLGLPKYLQVDNEATFYGSPAYPRRLGKLLRLCLLNGVQVCFIPLAEPWRNGVVEKFNEHWQKKFIDRVPMETLHDLLRESLLFEQRHNSQYRYSKLGGKTPLDALAAAKKPLRFPPNEDVPQKLPLPETGFYHIVRFIRSEGQFNLFGEGFPMPPEAVYEYVWATVDVRRQRVSFYLEEALIDEQPYRMR